MADKITESTILAIGVRYISDYTTETKKTIFFKIQNPRNNLTEQQIRNVAEPLLTRQTDSEGEEQAGAFWTDPKGDMFDSSATVHTAYTEYVRTYEYDLETP